MKVTAILLSLVLSIPVFAASKSRPFANELTTIDDFNEFAIVADGVVHSRAIKFFMDNRGADPKVYFINANHKDPKLPPDTAKFHYNFGKAYVDVKEDPYSFNQMTYFTNDLKKKKFIVGTLQEYTVDIGGKVTFIGIQFYPEDLVSEGTMLYAVKALKAKINIPNVPVHVVAYGIQQTFKTVQKDLTTLGIKAFTIDQIVGSAPFIVMNKGEAWGRLVINPKDPDLLEPTDIPLFLELPLDLSVVAGTITTVIQDAGSHINLKMKERSEGMIKRKRPPLPNLVLRDKAKLNDLKQKALEAQKRGDEYYIHFLVTESNFEIDDKYNGKPVTLEVVKNMNVVNDRPWQNVESTTDKTMRTFDEMALIIKGNKDRKVMANTYGGKAANLGFLAHKQMLGMGSDIQKKMKYRITPIGMGIPVGYYSDFVKANPEVKRLTEDMMAHEMPEEFKKKTGKSVKPYTQAEKVAAVKKIQEAFYNAVVPEGLATALKKKIPDLVAESAKYYPDSPIKKVKLRSSANAEDVEDFDGAGLHSSYGTQLEDFGDPKEPCKSVIEQGVETKETMQPKTVMCALKGVYASLWNKRAIDERSYARLDHRDAKMGIALNQSYDFRKKKPVDINETGNAVVITKILNSGGMYGYRISTNDNDNLVTNPTPNTQSEVVLALFSDNKDPEFSYLQFAKPKAGEPMLTKPMFDRVVYDRLVQLAQAVEIGYCKTVPSYYRESGGSCEYVIFDLEKAKSLDMEMKIYSNGEVLVKQMREFAGK